MNMTAFSPLQGLANHPSFVTVKMVWSVIQHFSHRLSKGSYFFLAVTMNLMISWDSPYRFFSG